MRLGWKCFDHARDLERFAIVELKGLPHWIAIGKVTLRALFGEDDGVGCVECCCGISRDEGDGKDVEKAAFHVVEIFLGDVIRFPADGLTFSSQSRAVNDLWKLFFQGFRYGNFNIGNGPFVVAVSGVPQNAIDPVGIFVKSIVAQFVLYKEHDQHAARNTNGESRDVDKRIDFVTQECADGDGDVIFEHGSPC